MYSVLYYMIFLREICCLLQFICREMVNHFIYIQGSARRLALGCVNSCPMARGSKEAGFTQPRDHLIAQLCTLMSIIHCKS